MFSQPPVKITSSRGAIEQTSRPVSLGRSQTLTPTAHLHPPRFHLSASALVQLIVMSPDRSSLCGCHRVSSTRPHLGPHPIRSQSALSPLLRLCLVVLVFGTISPKPSLQTPQEVFTNSFHVRFVRDVSHQTAHQIANQHGFVNLGPVSAIVCCMCSNVAIL